MSDTRMRVKSFFSSYPAISFAKGTVFFRPDDKLDSIFYLEQGMVRQCTTTPQGEPIILMTYKPPTIFPLLEVLATDRNQYFFEGTSNGSVRQAPTKAFLKVLTRDPEMLLDFATRVARGVDGMLHHLGYILNAPAQHKIVSTLCIAARRFGVQSRGARTLVTTHQEIAAQSGLTRETVTRTLLQLRERGLIGYQGRKLVIPNLNKLEKELL